MVLQLTIDEINGLLRQKTDRVSIACKGTDTVTVTYVAQVKVPLMNNPVSKRFSGDLRLVSVHGSRLTAEVDVNRLGAMVLNQLKTFFAKKAPAGLVESFDGRIVRLNLSALPEARRFLDTLDINNVMIAQSVVYVDASLKA